MALPPTTFTARRRSTVVPLAQRRVGGSGLAEGLSLLGRVGAQAVERDRQVEDERLASEQRMAEEEQRRERSRRAVMFGAQLAEARIAYQERASEERANTEPGAPGWADRSRELVQEVFAPLLSTFSDDEELALHLAPQLQSVTASIVSQEIDWEARARTEWEGQQFETMLQGEADGVLGNPTPEAMEQALERAYGQLALTDYDGTTKAKLAQLARRTIVGSTFDGMAQAGQYDALEALLQSGRFDGMLGDDKANYLRTVEAGRTAQAREAEQAASAARDEWRDAWATIEGRLERDPTLVKPAEVQALVEQGRALGVPQAELDQVAFLFQDTEYARSARGKTDAQLAAEMEALLTRRQAGQISAEEARYLDRLEKEQGARDGEAGESLSTLWKSGPEGQAQAVGQLAAMDPERAWAAASRAGNPRMAIYARLGGDGQRLALQGRAAREARPDDFLPIAQGKPSKDAAKATFRAFVGEPLVRQLGGAYDEVFEAAMDVMAGTGGEWNAGNFQRAVRVIFGARRRADGAIEGGIGQVRGRMVELPGNRTAAEFDTLLSRLDFSTARYRGGGTASKADVLANFLPVPVSETGPDGSTLYTFQDAQGYPLLNESGRAFTAVFPGPSR